MFVKLQLVGLIIFALLAANRSYADSPIGLGGIPKPNTLKPCGSNDPVANVEMRLATKFGLDYLGCFHSDRNVVAPGSTKAILIPDEYAIALSIQGEGYTQPDLDNLLSTVRRQWKAFDPMSKEFKETYTASISELIKGNGSIIAPAIVSIKPELVAIDRVDDNYYVVTSIRTYILDLNGEKVASIKVNSDAVVLSNSHLIRLTIQRLLRDPTDVSQVQDEINEWARATAQKSLPSP